jgi:arylsulfatase A-like enzyme
MGRPVHAHAPSIVGACGPTHEADDPAAPRAADRPPDPTELARTPPRPNVILVTLDTLRADHLSCYGYERRTSPQLDRFAAGATRYARARSTAPWTLPSHASLFTGLYPFQHGAHSVKVNPKDSQGRGNAASLASGHTTLAEALRALGYRTGAVVANHGYLARHFRLDQGFEHYDVQREPIGRIVERVESWLERRRDGPFFLFVNTMDTHRPYNTTPRPGFLEREIPRQSGPLLVELYEHVLGTAGPAPEKLRTLVDQYDLAIANLDEGLGRLFDRLRELGLFDESLIVITSDHGEYFGEHDLIEHSKDVYEPALHVPLFVKLPAQQHGAVDERPISLVHVPGLVLDGVLGGGATGAAAKLVQSWPADELLAECYYSRLHDLRAPWGARFDRIRTVLYAGDVKYIRSSDGRHELYDLAADHDELANALTQDPSRAAAFERRLDEFLRTLGGAAEAAEVESIDQETAERLRGLGY